MVTRKHAAPRSKPLRNVHAASAVITVNETAALLRVERKTVYGLVGRGDLPGVRRFGRLIRISRDAVLRWLNEGGGSTVAR